MDFYYFAEVAKTYPTNELLATVEVSGVALELSFFSDYKGRHAVQHDGITHLLGETPADLGRGVFALEDAGEIGFFYDSRK